MSTHGPKASSGPELFEEVVDRASTGLTVRRAVLGEEYVDASIARTTSVSQSFLDIATQFVWGTIWSRPDLDLRSRRMVTIGMLVALNRPEEIELHIRAALVDGMPISELREVLIHTSIYAGMPSALAAFRIAERVVDELAVRTEEVVTESDGGTGEKRQ